VNAGDVRIEGGDVFGEAVNIAARIEGKAGAGEIYFSESVFLSMTRSEVPSEEVGYTELKGISEKIRLYRVPRAGEAGGYVLKERETGGARTGAGVPHPLTPATLPFGGQGLDRVRDRLGSGIPVDAFAPAMDQARGFFEKARSLTGHVLALGMRFYLWWRTEVRRSKAVRIGTVIAVLAITAFLIWVLKPKPATPWQKFKRSLGF